MMISVILGRAYRGLTANPVMRTETGTASGARAAQRSAGRRREGFLTGEE